MGLRKNRNWDLNLLYQKIEEQDATVASKHLPPMKWRYVFMIDNREHEISKAQFDGDAQGWPKAGKYIAEGYGENDEEPLVSWEGTHYDERSSREDRGNPTEMDAVRRAVNDQMDQLRFDMKDAYRQRDQSIAREKAARSEQQATADALLASQRENLYLRRQAEQALLEKEEAEMREEVAREELAALMAKGGELSRPAERFGYGLVQSLLENVFDMAPHDIPSEVRAAVEEITMAVVHCPEAQAILYEKGLLPRPSKDDPNHPILLLLRAAGYEVTFEDEQSESDSDDLNSEQPTGDDSTETIDTETEEGETSTETNEPPNNTNDNSESAQEF
jgi:hypothetical protein